MFAAGADLNPPNVTGKTPLSVAPNDTMRQMLIEAGAK